MSDMIVMLREPGLHVTVVPAESVTLESHDMHLKRTEEDGRWGLVRENPEPEGGHSTLLCSDPGYFYRHPTDHTLHLTLFDPTNRYEVEKYTVNVIKLARRVIRDALGVER